MLAGNSDFDFPKRANRHAQRFWFPQFGKQLYGRFKNVPIIWKSAVRYDQPLHRQVLHETSIATRIHGTDISHREKWTSSWGSLRNTIMLWRQQVHNARVHWTQMEEKVVIIFFKTSVDLHRLRTSAYAHVSRTILIVKMPKLTCAPPLPCACESLWSSLRKTSFWPVVSRSGLGIADAANSWSSTLSLFEDMNAMRAIIASAYWWWLSAGRYSSSLSRALSQTRKSSSACIKVCQWCRIVILKTGGRIWLVWHRSSKINYPHSLTSCWLCYSQPDWRCLNLSS